MPPETRFCGADVKADIAGESPCIQDTQGKGKSKKEKVKGKSTEAKGREEADGRRQEAGAGLWF